MALGHPLDSWVVPRKRAVSESLVGLRGSASSQLVALAEKPVSQRQGQSSKEGASQKPGSASPRANKSQSNKKLAVDAPSSAPRFSKVVQECLEQQSHGWLRRRYPTSVPWLS